MTASIRSLRSLFASTRNLFVLLPGSVASLLLTIGLVICSPGAGAQTASYGGAYEVLGGQLTYPTGVALDTSGNVYLAMPALSAVEEIPASCIAGANNNTCVIMLGGGFSNPTGVAVDASGNVYVADTDNDAIKEIPASCIAGDNNAGCVIPLGGGFREPYGVAVDGSGDVFVADTFKSKVTEIPASCISGANDAACVKELGAGYFASPIGVAVDGSGNVYVGDTGNGTVDEIPYSCIQGANNSTCVTTLGGGFDSPYGVSVDGGGNVFVADAGESKVAEIPSGCTLSSCVLPVGGGFDDPYGVAVGTVGNVYVADTSNWAVKKIWMQGADFGAVPVAAGTPALRSLIFVFNSGGAIGTPVVVTEGATSKDFTDAGTGSCTTQGTSHVYEANDVCTVDVNLTPLYPGERMGAVLLQNNSGTVLATGRVFGAGEAPQITFATTTSGTFAPNSMTTLGSGFSSPVELAVDASGNVFVADQGTNKVYEIPFPGGSPIALAIASGGPSAVALDGAGNLYYADLNNGTVYEILWAGGSYNGGPIALASGFSSPTGLAVDSNGNVFVTSASAGKIYEIEAVNGVIPASPAVVQLASATSFNYPYSLAVDAGDNVYVVGWDNALEQITVASGYTTVNTLASFSGPVKGVSLDAAGDIFVAGNDSIYEVMAVGGSIPATPAINTVGSGFSGTMGVALDGSGNVYVSDNNHSQVKKLDFTDAPTLNFATTSIGFTSSDSPQTVTAINDGNQPLNFSGLSAPADFPLASTGGSVCSSSTTLAESASCTLPIDFTPENTGSLSESLTLADNNLNATNTPGTQQSITLTSYGNPAPDTTTTYVSVGSGSLNTGQTMTVTASVSDTGVRGTTPTGSVIFSWSCSGICGYDTSSNTNNTSGSLNGGSSVGLVNGTATLTGVSFSTAGTYTITAIYSGVSETFLGSSNSAQSDGNNQTTVSWVSATASAPAATSLGTVSLGSTATQTVTFTIQTAGTIGTPVVVTEGATGMDFTDVLDGSCDSNNGGNYGYNSSDTCTVDVKFTPQYPGTRLGAVLLEDNSGNILATAYVYGTGSGPQASFLPGAQSTVTTSTLSGPASVAIDASGNLYIADSGNSRVLKETRSGGSYTESTVGSGWSTPNSVAVDGAGNLYVSDAGLNEVAMLPWTGSGYGAAVPVIGAGQVVTVGIAVDGAGNVYVADSQNGRILMETPQGGSYSQSAIITGLNQLNGVAVDGSGNLYLIDVDGSNHPQVVQETLTEGSYTPSQVAGNLTSPNGLAVDLNGNVYIAEGGTTSVLKETLSGGSYSSSTIATVANPAGVAVDQLGNLYITSTSTNLLYKQDFADAPTLSFNTTAVGFTSSDSPQTVTVDNDGNVSLVFSGLSTPTDFPLASTGGSVCSSSTTLAANTSCTLPIDFTPVGTYPYSTTSLSESLSLTDNSLNVSSASQTISVSGTGIAPTITFSSPVSTTLTSGTVGVSYSVSFTAAGGASPYTYSGTVPAGLTLSSGGSLSGTPTTVESSYSITVTATDKNGFTGSQIYSLTIGQGTATINITPYSVTYDGNSHTATGTATGASALDLSAGLNLTGTTHTNAGSYTADAWSFHDPSGNYADSSGTVSDTISQATATINITPYSVNFDGNPHSASGMATGVGSVNLSGDLDLSGTIHTNAGIYTSDAWSFHDASGNYADANGTVSDTITMVPATATAPAATSLGSVNIGSSTAQAVTFTIQTAGAIGMPVVVTQGATGLDFTDAGDGSCTLNNGNSYGYSANATCTVDVMFAPQYPGPRYGAVLLEDTSGNILATAYVYGTGSGPLVNFAPGTQATVSASGMNQTDDVAVDASGNLYIASYANHEILKETLTSGSYSQSVLLSGSIGGLTIGPEGVAVDGAGNLYIADTDNSRVLVETLSNGSYTLSSTFSSGLTAPDGVAVDGSGNVYIADSSGNGVYVETLSNGSYSLTNTFSGLSNPSKVAVDASGNVYIADTGNNTVWVETLSGGSYTQTAVATSLNGPRGVAVDLNGNVYIADQGSNTIWKETLSAGSYSQSVLVTGLNEPRAVALDGSGNLYIADFGDNSVYKQDLADAPTLSFNQTAVGFTSTDSPQTVTVNDAGNASLVFSNLSTPTDFPLASTGGSVCSSSTTLAANTSCTLPIDFTPATTNASFSESLSLADNSLNLSSASQSISLGGTGIAPTITFSSPVSTTLTPGTVGVPYSGVSFQATGGSAPYTYSGTVPAGLTLSSNGSLSGTPTTVENSYSINVTATDKNGFTGSQSYSLTIGQGTATINITPYNVTYDANPHTATGTATGANSLDLSAGLTLTGTTHTNAGSYTADAWSFHDPSGNYADASGTVSDTISQATATINITPYSLTYDGNAHTASGTATGVGSVNLGAGLNLTGTTHTNAGSYPSDAWSFHDASGNYADANGTVSDTISQANAAINVLGYSVNYDGNPHSASGTATGVGSVNLSADLNLSGTAHTAVGSYPNDGWSFTDPTGNYAFASGTVSDSISQVTATATAPAPYNFGSTSIGSTGSYQVTFTFQTVGSIGTPVVVTQGATGQDFTDLLDGNCNTNGTGYDYSVLATCTVDVQFSPQHPGPRYGAVLLEDTSGNILATVYVYGIGAGPQTTFATNSAGVYAPKSTTSLGGGFNSPYLTAVDGSGDVYLADYNNNAVKEIPSGCSNSSCVLTLGGGFNNPIGVAVDGAGNVFVGDAGHSMVKMIPFGCTSSACVVSLGSGFSRPSGVAVDGSGNVFVADSSNSSISEILAVGGYTTFNTLGSGFSRPSGIAVDGSGNVFVADQSTNLVSEITAASGYTTVNTLGSGFLAPFGVVVDAAGNVYVADTGHAKVKEMVAVSGSVPASPTINLLGNGFSSPIGVALDESGNVYVSDGNAVKELDYADPPLLSFVTTAAGSTSADSPQTVTVTDDGNASLVFSGLSTPTDFKLDSTGGSVCSSSTTLASNTSCTLPIDFMPTTNTLLSESLTLNNNSLNVSSASQSISLGGTGIAPSITFTSPASTTLSPGAVGVPYSGASFQATGGASPYTYSGTVPAGMTLSTDGVLSGTPAAAETPYSLTVTATDMNGFTGSQSYSLTIGPGTATINITPYDVTYDGNAHTATATATGVGGAALSSGDFTLTGTTHTNAGSYSDSWSFHDPSGTYADASGTITDTIAKAWATVDTNSYNVTYDGNAHTATGTATGVGGANLNSDLNLTGTTHTNAGNYANDAWSFHDSSDNYADASGTMIDTIAKASATIDITPYDVTYDGNAHTATGTATGVSSANLNADLTLTNTTHTNAGSYLSDSWSFTDPNGNYSSASGTISDTIAKASATINVTPYDVTYDGNAHTATGTATGVSSANLNADLALNNTTHTNAGSYSSDAWSFHDSSGNYADAGGTVSDTIAKASAAVNVMPYSVTYDGNAHTATGTATGVGGTSLSSGDFTLTGTTHTNAGSYPSDAWSFSDPSGNYLSASGTVSDTIAKASATINVTPYDVTYDGNAHTATGTATGMSSANLNADLTLTNTTHTNAGSYTSDAWSFTDPNGNYSSASGTVSDTINDATATVTLGSLAQTYTGSPLSATASTNPPGLTVSFMYTGKDGTTYGPSSTPPTAAGSYTIVGAISNETDYIGSNSGTMVIAKAASQVASLLSSSNPTAPGSFVTFTATVSSTAGTPTGTVSFVDNSGTTLGQGTLSNGIATLTTEFTNAQDGSNSITAVYSGDSNFLGSSSGILTETVMAFSLSPGAGSVTTQTVSSGGTATYDLSITPTSGTTFPMAVTLTVSGMPPDATATISPSTWTQLTSTSWSLPANTALTAITLSIQMPASSSRLDDLQGTTGRKLPPVLWGVLLLPFAGRMRRAGKRVRRAISLMLLLAASLAVVTALGGCGGGSSSTSSSSSDYTITVTATAGAVSNSTTLTLIVN